MLMTLVRFALFAVLALTWLWLGRPRRARWIERLRDQDLALVCGAAVLINLLLVVAACDGRAAPRLATHVVVAERA